MRSILLYGCKTWPMRVVGKMMLVVLDNGSIRRMPYARRRDCASTVELQRRLRLTSISPQLVQRRLLRFWHGARRPEASLVVKASSMPTEDVGVDTKGIPRHSIWTTSFRMRTMEKRLGKNLRRARAGPSKLGRLYLRRGQFHWRCRLSPPG